MRTNNMDLEKDSPYERSFEYYEDTLNQLEDEWDWLDLELEEKLDSVGLKELYSKYRKFADNMIIFSDALMFTIRGMRRSRDLDRYYWYIKENNLDKEKYSFYDWLRDR